MASSTEVLTAAQAAQKVKNTRSWLDGILTAAQAAQKKQLMAKRYCADLTAAQAAQKCLKS